MRKVWFGELVKDTLCMRFQRVPLSFLKLTEQEKAEHEENMIFGGFVSVGQLRWWARFWLWLDKIGKIKVW